LDDEVFWKQATEEMRGLMAKLQDMLTGNEKMDRFSFIFSFPDPEFKEFLAKELAAEAGSLSKKAFENYDPAEQKSQFESTAQMFVEFKNQVNGFFQLTLPIFREVKVEIDN